MYSQALVMMAQYFEKVEVPCVVGNHGRLVIKPPSKDKYVDWDYMMYQWMAQFCREQKNIKFVIPRSFIHIIDVAGRKILMLHGDSIKSWNQIPFYGMIRSFAQLRQVLQDINPDMTSEEYRVLYSQFDDVIMGHFHQVVELDIGTGKAHICGCVKGQDEFAFARLHTGSPPQQILTYWHPDYGYIGKEILYLKQYDTQNVGSIKDALPEVWSETDVMEMVQETLE